MPVLASYQEWEDGIADEVKQDSLWKMTAYRLSLFAGDVGWEDVKKLMHTRPLRGIADQLYRALGSISANIAEGYSRSTGKDRARFYEYSLGSARESREWYFKARHVLGDDVYRHRLELLTRIIQLLTATIPKQRKQGIREPTEAYQAEVSEWLLTTEIPYMSPDF